MKDFLDVFFFFCVNSKKIYETPLWHNFILLSYRVIALISTCDTCINHVCPFQISKSVRFKHTRTLVDHDDFLIFISSRPANSPPSHRCPCIRAIPRRDRVRDLRPLTAAKIDNNRASRHAVVQHLCSKSHCPIFAKVSPSRRAVRDRNAYTYRVIVKRVKNI